MNLSICVKEIKGHCPVYKINDSFVLEEGYRLVARIPLCMHALSSLMPFYSALRLTSPSDLGLAGTEDSSKAYVQCPDVHDRTGGGTVLFEIERVPSSLQKD